MIERLMVDAAFRDEDIERARPQPGLLDEDQP
jgi:hypothetical protein